MEFTDIKKKLFGAKKVAQCWVIGEVAGPKGRPAGLPGGANLGVRRIRQNSASEERYARGPDTMGGKAPGKRKTGNIGPPTTYILKQL